MECGLNRYNFKFIPTRQLITSLKELRIFFLKFQNRGCPRKNKPNNLRLCLKNSFVEVFPYTDWIKKINESHNPIFCELTEVYSEHCIKYERIRVFTARVLLDKDRILKGQNPRFCFCTGEYGLVKTRILALSMQWNPVSCLLLHKKWSFPLKISSVNVTKYAGIRGLGHIYWRNP